MTSVAILSLDNQDLHTDARVMRQIKYLSKDYAVHVITYGNAIMPLPLDVPASINYVGSLAQGVRKRQLKTMLYLTAGKVIGSKAYEKWYWDRPGHKRALELLLELKPAVVHANDWWSLPVAGEAARITGAKLVLDLHEYALEEIPEWWKDTLYKNVIDYFLTKYSSCVDASVTVNGLISERYQREYGFKSIVVMNAPDLEGSVSFHPTNESEIKLVHHGFAFRGRKIERLIDMVGLTDSRYNLTLMLLGDTSYIRQLENYASNVAPGRIKFISPVRADELARELNVFDIGVFIVEANTFNHHATLPNKFFDFVAAGLAVLIGPSPEMANLVKQYGFGIVAPSVDAQTAADLLSQITPEQIDVMKLRSLEARKVLNARVELGKLIDLYRQVLGEPCAS
jgi:glycosyltransferase involved in cell wall biosynthesis